MNGENEVVEKINRCQEWDVLSFDDYSRAALAPLARINYKLTPNYSHYESRHVVVALPG